MAKRGIGFDRVFQALANPTRRRVVARLSTGEARMTELAQPFGMALPSFLQHLRVLEEAGLVRSSKVGRVRTYRLEPQVLGEVQGWLEDQCATWESRLDRLDSFLEASRETQP